MLEHKIDDLRHQIQPKDETIHELRAQIGEMEEELNAVSRTQSDLEVQVKDARGKMAVSVSELNSEKKRSAKQQAMQTRLTRDVADLHNVLQDGKQLKEAVARLLKKHGVDVGGMGGGGGLLGGGGGGGGSFGSKSREGYSGLGSASEFDDDADSERRDALAEILRQKAFLEHQVASLRDQLKKARANHRGECQTKAKQIAFLIGEIEELKRELKQVRGYKMPRRLMKAKSTATTDDDEEAEAEIAAAAAKAALDSPKDGLEVDEEDASK